MRRMYSENQLIKLIEEHAEGQVQSVNGKTGDVVLKASDIKVNNSQSIQANLERIDTEIEQNIDDIASLEVALDNKLDLPSSAHPADCLLGIDPSDNPLTITVGSGLSLSNGQLSATGGGGDVYRHNLTVTFDAIGSQNEIHGTFYSSQSTSYTQSNLPANLVIPTRGTASDPVAGTYFDFQMYTTSTGSLSCHFIRWDAGGPLVSSSSTVFTFTDTVTQA